MKLRLIESLGATEYKIPKDDKTAMADFYAMQILLSVKHKDEYGQPVNPKYDDNLNFDLQYAFEELCYYLKDRLLKFGFYAIMLEGAHCFDSLSFHNEDGFLDYDASDEYNLEAAGQCFEDLGISDYDEFFSYADDREGALQNFRGREHKLVTGLREMFGLSGWDSAYGGEAWVGCCDAWLGLYRADNMSSTSNNHISIPIAIDIMYSTEHNTGAFLNKNDEYSGGWVQPLLDLKRSATINELQKFTSNYVTMLINKFRRPGGFNKD